MVKLFTYTIKWFITAIIYLSINSCTYFYKQSVIEDMHPNITEYIESDIKNESLFKEKKLINYGYQALFEDHRPHNIGDILTIVLQENISASNSSSADISHNASSNAGFSFIPGQFNPIFGINVQDIQTGLDSKGKHGLSGRGRNSANNKFTGLITVTVQDILPNGNLRVTGEKQVTINQAEELIRFSGVVNPKNINQKNLIASTQVADTHIEYITSEMFNKIKKMGWLQKILLKISPM
ncbi:flagellar basal body L-ring protein FlgH [Buchnera aphidicola]|uniref:flagellar basal body L-ring protein FlgH n=1 Tax=Buchnera aphidicola TaxID=9 RepID=UPI0034639BF9